MRDAVVTSDTYLNEIASHLIVAGGKRLRPVLAVPGAQIFGETASHDVVRGGVACELVHLGSLYHDDVMDEADTRRGVETVNAKWGNLQAILAGDFLLARVGDRRLVGHRGRRAARPDHRLAVRGADRGTASHLRHEPDRGELPRLDPRQDRLAVRDGMSHRRHRGRSRSARRSMRSRPTATRTARCSRSSTTSWTSPRPRSNWASRPATTSSKACTRCRCCARSSWATAPPRNSAICSAPRSTPSPRTRPWRSCARTRASSRRSPPRASTSPTPRRAATTSPTPRHERPPRRTAGAAHPVDRPP